MFYFVAVFHMLWHAHDLVKEIVLLKIDPLLDNICANSIDCQALNHIQRAIEIFKQ